MEKLFTTWPSNAHQSVLLSDSTLASAIAAKLNRISLLDGWQSIKFDVQDVDKCGAPRPDIAVCSSGWLTFPEAALSKLFPSDQQGLEFLPILVDEQQWFLLNCLNSVREFDAQNSEVLRGLNDEIFMVLKLRVTDQTARGHELFTLAASNRMQLFACDAFRKRVELSGLKGVTFKPIGEVL